MYKFVICDWTRIRKNSCVFKPALAVSSLLWPTSHRVVPPTEALGNSLGPQGVRQVLWTEIAMERFGNEYMLFIT